MRLCTTLPIASRESLERAILKVNDRPWGGFGTNTLKLVRVIPGRVRGDGTMEIVADFEVDVSGTADRMPVPEGLGRKPADRLRADPLFEATDFAAIFGDEPEFETSR